MKLELKHLAGYLPYGLKIYACYNEYILELEEDCNSEGISVRETIENYHKPILRPLSELIIHSDFIDKYHYSFDKKEGFMVKRRNETYTRIDELEYLYSKHFDIHNLIENGLAIDINTINQ